MGYLQARAILAEWVVVIMGYPVRVKLFVAVAWSDLLSRCSLSPNRNESREIL